MEIIIVIAYICQMDIINKKQMSLCLEKFADFKAWNCCLNFTFTLR